MKCLFFIFLFSLFFNHNVARESENNKIGGEDSECAFAPWENNVINFCSEISHFHQW